MSIEQAIADNTAALTRLTELLANAGVTVHQAGAAAEPAKAPRSRTKPAAAAPEAPAATETPTAAEKALATVQEAAKTNPAAAQLVADSAAELATIQAKAAAAKPAAVESDDPFAAPVAKPAAQGLTYDALKAEFGRIINDAKIGRDVATSILQRVGASTMLELKDRPELMAKAAALIVEVEAKAKAGATGDLTATNNDDPFAVA